MTITQNESTLDRFLRIIMGGACMLSTSYISMSNTTVLIVMIVGLYLMFSGLAGYCIIYKMFGIKTCK